ncbi:MAG: Hsp20 family protein [Promethearchaeota archaeon]
MEGPEAKEKKEVKVKPVEKTNDGKNKRALSRREVYSPFRLFSEFDRLMSRMADTFYRRFDDLFKDFGDDLDYPLLQVRRPRTDVAATDDAYIFRAELPGLSADDIDIEVDDDGFLVIKGEKKEEESKDGYFHSEQRCFYNKIALPKDALYNKDIEATLKDGLLDIKINRKKPKKTKIKVKPKKESE